MKFSKKSLIALGISALLLTACTPTVDPELGANPTIPVVNPTNPSQPEKQEGETLTVLSAAWKQQVEQDWYTATGETLGSWDDALADDDGIRYYGNHNGYDILFRPTGDAAVTNLKIEDVTFTYSTTFEIYAYRDGNFTPIKELTAQGKLSDGNLAEMLAVHRAYGMSSTDPGTLPGPMLTAEAQEKMKLAFLEEHNLVEKYTTSDLSVAYYGQYGEAHVGFINGIMMYTQALTSETIAGVTFRYNTGQKLQVYFEGELMGLQEAYDRGALTVEELTEIRDTLNPMSQDNVFTE